MTRLYRLAVATVVSTYALIVLGAITRISGSGMGCADDWPRCHGKWYPPMNLQSIIEYLHRTVAAYIGMLVLATMVTALLTKGTSARTRTTAIVALGMVIFQALLGAVTVWRELPPDVVTAHLGTAMLFCAATILLVGFIAIDRGGPAWIVAAGRGVHPPSGSRRFAAVALIGAVVVFVLILSGGLTSTTGAALACTQWPFCRDGVPWPTEPNRYLWINFSHRLTALLSGAVVVVVALEARRPNVAPFARWLANLAVVVFAAQVLVGAGYVFSRADNWLGGMHNAVATLLWATMVVLALVARRALSVVEPAAAALASESVPMCSRSTGRQGVSATSMGEGVHMAESRSYDAPAEQSPSGVAVATMASPSLTVIDPRRLWDVANGYLTLMKPGIIVLLLVTTLGAMLVAAEGVPPLSLVLLTLLGGTLTAGGANVINCFIDRDIDAQMPRTRKRATVTGRITPGAALGFGLVLSASGTLLLGFGVNWLAAGLALAGNIYYVFVYTLWLKRSSSQNIVIGGAAGAVPPLVGWAAATGGLAAPAWILFAIIYYWTPPHFWALALLKQGEYGRVGVPMLPVVAGEAETQRQILLYTVLLTAVALLLAPLGMSWLYLAGAVALNGYFLWLAVQLRRQPSRARARRTFFYSLWYLALLFAVMVADRLILA
ncbi:MAG: protoheme IX farnesyltransferase [Chloroflexia bacterium]|nr:protoheme IX farnesyltransferase [Chloroflexia bacterium]